MPTVHVTEKELSEEHVHKWIAAKHAHIKLVIEDNVLDAQDRISPATLSLRLQPFHGYTDTMLEVVYVVVDKPASGSHAYGANLLTVLATMAHCIAIDASKSPKPAFLSWWGQPPPEYRTRVYELHLVHTPTSMIPMLARLQLLGLWLRNLKIVGTLGNIGLLTSPAMSLVGLERLTIDLEAGIQPQTEFVDLSRVLQDSRNLVALVARSQLPQPVPCIVPNAAIGPATLVRLYQSCLLPSDPARYLEPGRISCRFSNCGLDHAVKSVQADVMFVSVKATSGAATVRAKAVAFDWHTPYWTDFDPVCMPVVFCMRSNADDMVPWTVEQGFYQATSVVISCEYIPSSMTFVAAVHRERFKKLRRQARCDMVRSMTELALLSDPLAMDSNSVFSGAMDPSDQFEARVDLELYLASDVHQHSVRSTLAACVAPWQRVNAVTIIYV